MLSEKIVYRGSFTVPDNLLSRFRYLVRPGDEGFYCDLRMEEVWKTVIILYRLRAKFC